MEKVTIHFLIVHYHLFFESDFEGPLLVHNLQDQMTLKLDLDVFNSIKEANSCELILNIPFFGSLKILMKHSYFLLITTLLSAKASSTGRPAALLADIRLSLKSSSTENKVPLDPKTLNTLSVLST